LDLRDRHKAYTITGVMAAPSKKPNCSAQRTAAWSQGSSMAHRWASGLSIGSVHKLSGPRYNAEREQCHLKRRRTGSRSTNTSRLNAPPNAGLSIAKAKWSVCREELVSMRRSHAIFSGTWLTGYPKPVKLTEAT